MQVDLLLVDAVHRMYIMRASVDQRIRYPSRYKDDERFYTGDRAATLPRQCDAARDPLNEKKPFGSTTSINVYFRYARICMESGPSDHSASELANKGRIPKLPRRCTARCIEACCLHVRTTGRFASVHRART